MNLRIPGPTPLPPNVREALATQMINHRGPGFAKLLNDVTDQLKYFYQTQNDVIVLTSSGTGAMEASVANMLSPGEYVLAVTMGEFGNRYAEIARRFGLDVLQLEYPDGKAADPDDIAKALDANPGITTVLVTHNETSTGVTNDLEPIARIVKSRDKLLMVDGISSVGSIDLKTDEWECDVVLSGSQKGWMAPPGLAFASISPYAWDRHAKAKLPRFYFDFTLAKQSAAKGETPWTPGMSVFFALQVSLQAMRAEGRDAIFARHARLAKKCRDGALELGLTLFADPAHASNTVTSLAAPDGVDSRIIARELEEEYDTVVAIGRGATANKVLRIGHLGWVTDEDIDAVLDSVGQLLQRSRSARADGH